MLEPKGMGMMPDWVLPFASFLTVHIVTVIVAFYKLGVFTGTVSSTLHTLHKDIISLTSEIKAERIERATEIRRLWASHNEHLKEHQKH